MLSLSAIKGKKLRTLSIFLLILIITALPPLSYRFVSQASAGSLTNNKLLINNSQAGATAVSYNFRFTTSATTNIKQINVKFCTQAGAFTDTCTAPSGMSASSAVRASDNIAGTGRTDTLGANTLQTVITTPSSQSTQSVTYDWTTITNPSTINTTFYARIITYSDTGSTTIDTGQVAFAVLDTTSIAVTATVDPNLTFTVAGVSSGGTVNSATTNITTTASTIPFGSFTIGSSKIGAHDITITTNAGNGYTVTASHSATSSSAPPLLSGTNDIDAFSGTNTSPTTWSAPAGGTANTNTGYFGYTTEDATLCTGTAARFTSSGGNKWAGSTNVGTEVACDAAGVSSQTTRVGWQAQVNAIQPAGTYSGTVILIATPTY